MFDRYNVVSMSDVAEATQKLENRKLREFSASVRDGC